MNASKLMGEKLMALSGKKNAAKLQATVIAMACMGAYSSNEGAVLDLDDLIALRDMLIFRNSLISSGEFPLQTLEDCTSAFEAALQAAKIFKGDGR